MAATKSRVCKVIEPITTTTGDIQITETTGNKVTIDRYFVREIPCEIGGRAFTFGKMAKLTFAIAEEYTCRLAGQDSSCTCKWGSYGAHLKPCRHLSILTALASRGQLPAATQSQPVRDWSLNEAEFA